MKRTIEQLEEEEATFLSHYQNIPQRLALIARIEIEVFRELKALKEVMERKEQKESMIMEKRGKR